MNLLGPLRTLRRWPNDPRILRSGHGSLVAGDHTARWLGWFSIGIGLTGLFAARRLTRALGLPRSSAAVARLVGARELASGVATLAVDPRAGLWSRVGGDVIDLALLGTALRQRRGRRDLIGGVAAGVGALLLVDLLTASAIHDRHRRRGPLRDFGDRSGLGGSPAALRGAAAGFATPARLRHELPRPGGSRPPGALR